MLNLSYLDSTRTQSHENVSNDLDAWEYNIKSKEYGYRIIEI